MPPAMETVTNHFVHATAAARYAEDRPYFHPRVIALIRDRLQLAAPLPCALDVGCGTGMSARALREIAREVIATDASPAMLAQAPALPGIHYRVAPAESLPFAAAAFPLLTVALAFHWFDRPRFLAEAARVLAPGGWLILYGHQHSKTIAGAEGYRRWYEEEYLRHYPLTARNGEPVSPADLVPHGLELRERSEFAELRPYTAEGFTRVLLTHSNVIRRVADGVETLAAAAAWINAGLAPFFQGQARDCGFTGWIAWIQKPHAQP